MGQVGERGVFGQPKGRRRSRELIRNVDSLLPGTVRGESRTPEVNAIVNAIVGVRIGIGWMRMTCRIRSWHMSSKRWSSCAALHT